MSLSRLLSWGAGALLCVWVGLSACQPTEELPAPEAPSAAAPAPVVSPPFDVGDVVRRVGLAWRAEGTRFTSAQAGHAVEVGGGTVTFQPGAPSTREAAKARAGASLSLETVSLGRRGAAATPGARVEVMEDGGLALHRGAVRETLRNTEAGVEQAWEFPGKPTGEGPLTVRLRVGGQRFVRASGAGLHFAPEGDGPGARYGLATWVDARGVRTPLPAPRFERGEVVLEVPEALLESSEYPAVLDPLVSPEGDVGLPPAPGVQTQARVASDRNGTGYLVVWEDGRHGTERRIYAARVDGDGRVLDPSGLALSGTAMGRQPRVAFDGTFYLVTWLDSTSRVRATRVATTGQVMDPPFRVYDSPQVQSVYAVAGDVFGFLVVWLTPTGGGDQDMMGCRLSGGGTPMGPCPFRIHGPVGSTSGPAVASTGSSFLVVWDGGGDIHGATVSATGTVSPRFPVTSAAGSQVGPDVAGSGSGAFVVWTDSSAQAINGTRVSPEGARLDATDLVLAPPGTTFLWPQAGYDGRDYMVIWRDTRTPARYQVRAARVTPQGTVVNPDGVELGAAGNTQEGFGPASIAGGGGRALAVWEAMGATTQQDIVGTRVGQVTAALDVPPRFISTVGVGQSWPDVAFDGRNYLVAWSDSRADGNGDIYATRVDPTGRVLDPAGIAVATAQAAGAYQWTPKVASSASGFLVTWSEYRDSSARTQVYATLVGGDGRVARPGGLSLVPNANSQEDSSVASDGTNFLVAWRELVRAADGSLQDDFIRSVLVSGASGAPTAVRTLANPSLSVMHPEVAFSGSNYLVVWVDFRGGPSPIHANRVDRAGDVLDGTTGFSTGVPAYSTYADLSLAAGPEGFLLAFYARNWDARRGIFMSRLGSNGRAVASPGVALSAGNVGAVTPEVVFDGMNYVVAWYQGFDPYDVMANRVTPGGVVLDGTGFPVSSTARSEYVPALATDGRGTVLVAYGVQGQVKQRFIRSLEAGQPCTLASDCGSGFCVDGVCCDSACGGGVATDCQACSVAAGGRVDGTCSAVGAGRTCRASAGDCDVAEACDGSGLACPEDGFMEVGTECRASAGGCDVAEACPGTSAACPVDGFAEAGGECRPTAGACDPAEVCSGTARECPEDALLPAGTECRAAVGACDVAERCGGDSALCPENASAPDGTACDDGSACTQTDSCQSGACAGAAPVVCEAPNPCMRAGVCDPATGGCSAPVPVEDGTACNDGNACTQTDTCQAGTCMGASPVVCTGGDACNTAGTCNPATGQCSAPVPVADGTACSDGNACTQTDTCTAGACGGANPVVCAAADACHVAGTCNPTTGVCSDPEAEEGTTCPGGACQAGTCVPTPDAGTADGGTDAGTDAGSEPDAGQTPDAGDTVDGGPGTPRPLPPHDPMGCGCGVPAGSSNMGLLLLIAGAALLRRSRRQRS